ncbi:MAG: DUF503 domain-containing protein [Myxococcaceae bacterium]|nr:DUF503 domain-containing protein [Myxococcaceae bacterium]
MFVCVGRVTLQIPESGSLKAKRQVLRRITDRVKARFNASVAEVDDNDLWQKAQLAMAVVGNDRRHVGEQMDKILQFIEDLYVAPVTGREVETLSFGDELYGSGRRDEDDEAHVPSLADALAAGQRSLAEAEGLGEWDRRHEAASDGMGADRPAPAGARLRPPGRKLSLDEARARARALRNPRDWEKK